MIIAGIVVVVVLCLVAFARFITWKDNRDMADADASIHWVKHGVFDTRMSRVEW